MSSYILHVSLLLGLGFILYQVLLKKETFYALNRMILNLYLILAFTLPLIHIPQEWSLKFVDHSKENNITVDHVNNNRLATSILPTTAKQILKSNIEPSTNSTNPIIDRPVETKLNKKTETKNTPSLTERIENWISLINWSSVLKWTYFIGLSIFFINFLVQFSILIFYRLKFPTLKDGKMTIVEMEGNKAPFSFLNMIYINPSKYDYDTYEQILAHEKIHISKWHSFDIFLSEIALIILWFNPFAWLYRKVVEHNLEYLTDQEMLAAGANAEAYQMNLLKVSVPELPLSLSTNYNQSFLKKRIHMMNAKKSSASSTWKYLFILPILGLSIALLNPIHTTAQQPENIVDAQKQLDPVNQLSSIEKSSPIAQLDPKGPLDPKNKLAEVDPIIKSNQLISSITSPLTSSEIIMIDSKKQMDNSICAIKELSMFNIEENIDLSVSEIDNGFSIISNDGRTFSIETTNGRTLVTSATEDLENEGIWEGELNDGEVCLHIKKGGIGKNYYWNSSECFRAFDFSPTITKNIEGEFTLTREPGELVLKGEFENGKGVGRYNFTPNPKFISSAQNYGYEISEKKLIHFFLSGMESSFFSFLKANGYNNIKEDDILSLAIHDVNEEYIKDVNGAFRKANYSQPNVEELVSMKIHDVDMDYIQSFGTELYENLTVDQIISAAIHDVDPKFISEFKALGYPDLTFDNLLAASIHDVDLDYIKEMKGAGFEDLTFENLIAAAIHDVDPEYIKAFKAEGMDVTFDNMIAASIHDIDLDYIKEFKEAGMTDLTFDNLVAAGIHDVDVDYLKEAKKYGFDLTFDQLIQASIHNVDLDYIEAFSNSGLKNLNFDHMIQASIHDIDPQFIKDFNALGYSDLTFDNLITAAIHDVDIDYIKDFKQTGFTDLTFDNFIAASIHDIEPAYVKELKELNIKNITFDNIISFGIHDIQTADIKGFKALGFNLPADKLIEARIHGLTPEFIKKMQEKGYKNLDFDEYLRLKIHGS